MSTYAGPILELRNVRFGYDRHDTFLGPINLKIERGSCWAIVGPNGAGKSTLLRLMAGLHKPREGFVLMEGRNLHAFAMRERARRIAFLPQHMQVDLHQSAREIVLMGRYPHRTLSLFESARDYAVADRAMMYTQTEAFADRRVANLSAGEAQRVHIAAAIAQQPSILLVDEPTASLDLKHQLAVFETLTKRAWGDESAVVIVTHDLNLAARYCPNILLLHAGRLVRAAAPNEVITPPVLEPVYGVKMTILSSDDTSRFRWIAPVAGKAGEPA